MEDVMILNRKGEEFRLGAGQYLGKFIIYMNGDEKPGLYSKQDIGWHTDAYHEVMNIKNSKIEVKGGGLIIANSRKIKAYNFSSHYGKFDTTTAKRLLEDHVKDNGLDLEVIVK